MGAELRVYGPPGTGKTTWIANKATACAKKYGGDQVSLCSLTNTAVKEVVNRDIPIPKGNISTLHARCKRALFAGDPAEVDVEIFIDDNKGWSSIGGSTPCLPASMVKRSKTDMSEDILAGNQLSLFENAQILRQRMIPRNRWPEQVRKFSDIWEDWCRQTGRMDFTGWLEEALRSDALPAQQVIFIDEAQDHTPLQLAVIRKWSAHHTVLVGDDDQCCYEWSGSVPGAFFEARENLKEEKVLSQSYRVPHSVFHVANRLVKKIRSRKEKEYLPRDDEGTVTNLDYSTEDAMYEGRLPEKLLDNPDETYMIIASCAYMLNPIIDCLKSQRIPFHNPYRSGNAKWNPLRTFLKCIQAYQVKDRMWTGDEAVIWAGFLKAKGVFKQRMKQRFIDLCTGFGTQPLETGDIDKYFLPDIRDRILHKDISIIRDERSPSSGFDWDYAWDVYESGDHKPRITVGTIHSVKGGEADNVYIFPDISTAGLNDYLGPGSDRVYRLFYVGVTRARKNLFLCAQGNPYRAINWE